MITRLQPLAAIFTMAFVSTSLRAAEPTDPAELFPPGTLAYVELHDPAGTAPQIAVALKGSLLEDSISFIHTRRDKAKDPRDLLAKDQLAILGLLASPEMAAEFKKLRGVAVGVVGFNDQLEPEWAAAVLTGESSAAGLMARAFLTLTTVRKVAAIGDVPVYQFRQPTLGYDPNGQQILQNEKPPVEGLYEPTFAYVPGLFVAGTSKAAVGEVIARYQGKSKGSLAETPAFKAAVAAHRQTGVFFFANVAECFAKFDRARKKAEVADAESDSLGWFKLLANPKAIQTVAGRAYFRDGGAAVTIGATFDPAQKSPLLEVLSGTGAKVELLRRAPGPAAFALAISFPETNRTAAVVGFLDALAKAHGELGRTPGEWIKELEVKYKMPLAQNLIGKTRAAIFVLPLHPALPKGAVSLPTVVLQTESEEVAAAWEEILPRLIGDLGGTATPQASSEAIGNLKVFSLPAGTLPWKAAVHYARKGNEFAIGLNRKLVAASLDSEAGKVEAAPPMVEANAVIGSMNLGAMIKLLTEVSPLTGPVVPRGPATPAKPVPAGRGFSEFMSEPPAGSPTPEAQKKDEAAAKEALFKSFQALPALSLAARRTGNELRFEMFQPKAPSGGFVPLIDAAVGWFDKTLNRAPMPNGSFGPRFGRFRGG